MYYKLIYLFAFMTIIQVMSAQDLPEVNIEDIKFDIFFLASDELKGRNTGEQGNQVAARFIAENFRIEGLPTPPGMETYMQNIPFVKRSPVKSGKMMIDDSTYMHVEDMLLMSGVEGTMTGELVFVEQAWVDDTLNQLEGIDLDGKIAVSLFGVPGSQDPRQGFSAVGTKRKNVMEQGAVGMIEIYQGGYPWSMLRNALNTERTMIDDEDEDESFVYILSQRKLSDVMAQLNAGQSVMATIESSGLGKTPVVSSNVIGYLEGSDPQLKDEYVILSAHYDHVGVGRAVQGDSIYNGARDNAIGTEAIISSARYFAENPPKRSLLFLAFTAEEMGLLGSNYYADNPVLPLNKAIFNMNIDGAGYNDTTRVTVIGHDRVGTLDIFEASAAAVGLEAKGDPVPEQGLFDRSDNVNFAKKGIPAPTFSPGITAFDQELMKYYHQPADEPQGLNYRYVKKFIQAYILSVQSIANLQDQPKWQEGDKYEEAYMQLYNMKP